LALTNQWEDSDLVYSSMGQLNVFPTFPILFDPKSEISEAFGVKGLPTAFNLETAVGRGAAPPPASLPLQENPA